MCMFSGPDTPDAPEAPKEYAQQKSPDGGTVRSNTGRRNMDRMRGASDTILTSGSGVGTSAPTEKKTLLGA